MSDNLLQTMQHLIQDVIAPDVRELKVRVASLEKQVDVRFDAVQSRFDALEKQLDARFEAIMSAISDSRSQAELAAFRAVAPVSERVAVLESQRQ
jgi:hypothetical protein